jgi:DNA-binding Lrp family transcriptional regulator
MDKKDKLILKELQFNFPFRERPYLEIGKRIGLSEEEVLRRTKRLKRDGFISYIGAIFNLRRLGFKSTLVGLEVNEKDIKRAVRVINRYPGVTHNYLREDQINIWFTLNEPSYRKLSRVIKEIKEKVKPKRLIRLDTLKVYKIDTRFNSP